MLAANKSGWSKMPTEIEVEETMSAMIPSVSGQLRCWHVEEVSSSCFLITGSKLLTSSLCKGVEPDQHWEECCNWGNVHVLHHPMEPAGGMQRARRSERYAMEEPTILITTQEFRRPPGKHDPKRHVSGFSKGPMFYCFPTWTKVQFAHLSLLCYWT